MKNFIMSKFFILLFYFYKIQFKTGTKLRKKV